MCAMQSVIEWQNDRSEKHKAHFAICRHDRFVVTSDRSANRQSRFKQAFWSSAASRRKALETIFFGVGSPASEPQSIQPEFYSRHEPNEFQAAAKCQSAKSGIWIMRRLNCGGKSHRRIGQLDPEPHPANRSVEFFHMVRIDAESSDRRTSCSGSPDLHLSLQPICSAQLSKDVTRVAIRQIDE